MKKLIFVLVTMFKKKKEPASARRRQVQQAGKYYEKSIINWHVVSFAIIFICR